MNLKKKDPQIAKLNDLEARRQKTTLQMIPSENHSSPAVREALGSYLTDKYAEGYPGKRYYGGNEFIDKVEALAIERAKKPSLRALAMPYTIRSMRTSWIAI